MRSSPVRDLARRYAAGQLSQENYRSQRRLLIDSIATGSQPLTYRDDENTTVVRRGSVKLVAIGVVVAVLAAAVLFIALRSGGLHKKAGAPAVAAAPAPLPPAPGPALVSTFVDANDWTDGSLETLMRHWGDLPADEQTKARDSLDYPRLVSDLRQQITSEKAMLGLGGAGTSGAHLAELQKTAKTLGIPAGS